MALFDVMFIGNLVCLVDMIDSHDSLTGWMNETIRSYLMMLSPF